jgi:hypothetical protein
MIDPQAPSPTASAVPAADIVAPAGNVGPIVHQSFPVRQPQEDANEIMVGVRGRILRRIRAQLTTLTKGQFPWPELLLGFATLCLGGFLGAIASSLPWAVVAEATAKPSARSILFYVVLPSLGAAASVGFFALRHISNRRAADVANAVLEDLPDPDHTL